MKKKNHRRMFRKTDKDLQDYLLFRSRGSKVESKKGKGSYNRKRMKKGDEEE